jgi:hypothetical protein
VEVTEIVKNDCQMIVQKRGEELNMNRETDYQENICQNSTKKSQQ